MSCNRPSYDDCDFTQRTQDRITPLKYQLYAGKYSQCNWCPKRNAGELAREGFSSELDPNQRVIIENELMNIDRKFSRCNDQKFHPTCPTCTIVVPTGAKFAPPMLCDRDINKSNLEKPTTTAIDGIGSWGSC